MIKYCAFNLDNMEYLTSHSRHSVNYHMNRLINKLKCPDLLNKSLHFFLLL